MYDTCRRKPAKVMKPYDVSLHRKHWKLHICLAKDCKSISTQPRLDIQSILAQQMTGCEKVNMLKQYVFKVGLLRRIPCSPSSRSHHGRRKHVQPHHQGVNWAKLQAGDSMCICLCVYLSPTTRQCSLQASAKSRLINNNIMDLKLQTEALTQQENSWRFLRRLWKTRFKMTFILIMYNLTYIHACWN